MRWWRRGPSFTYIWAELVKVAFTKVESPTLETVRALAKIERTFGITAPSVSFID